jgi:hypothetical protein
MSVECRILVGLTLEFARDLNHEDFRKAGVFTEKYPELDEYNYGGGDREGKLLLVGDGMNGDFLRLIKVDKLIDEGSLGDANEFMELAVPNSAFNPELIEKMSTLYEEYTGKPPALADFKYAMWSQWY